MSLVVPEAHQQFQVGNLDTMRDWDTKCFTYPAHSPVIEHQRRWKAQGYVRFNGD